MFELVKTASGYPKKSFTASAGSADGDIPYAGLIADANGDLFGTTEKGGARNDGTVFELVKTASGYTEKVLHSFGGTDPYGALPEAGLIADANGDLFGTTFGGGVNGDGTAFELVKTASGYTNKVLHRFRGTNADTSTSIAETHNGVVGLDSLLHPFPAPRPTWAVSPTAPMETWGAGATPSGSAFAGRPDRSRAWAWLISQGRPQRRPARKRIAPDEHHRRKIR